MLNNSNIPLESYSEHATKRQRLESLNGAHGHGGPAAAASGGAIAPPPPPHARALDPYYPRQHGHAKENEQQQQQQHYQQQQFISKPPYPQQQQQHPQHVPPAPESAQTAAAAPGTDEPWPPPLALSEWGLPPEVVAAYAAKGVRQLYRWQAAAVSQGARGNNLVYCAPTSGGKSIVAEVLMIRRLAADTRAAAALAQRARGGRGAASPPPPRALVVLPYLSVVSEKAGDLSALLAGLRWRVAGYQGERSKEGTPLAAKDERVAVCSIEKANVAVNQLLRDGRIGELSAVVVDEAHMVADPHRGVALEMLLTKLVAARCRAQVVCMSATMAGLEPMAAWLDARLFLTNYRPVPLTEHAVFNGAVYELAKVPPAERGAAGACRLEHRRALPASSPKDRDRFVPLVAEAAKDGHSVLVFCGGRRQAESCAAQIAELLPPLLPPTSAAAAAARAALVAELRDGLAGARNAALEALFAAGAAYHHAGLTAHERRTVEAGYRRGALLVLCATSTLAAGVNLPARRVILRSLWQGAGPVSRAQYLQMAGRAGRAGQSDVGEAFLMGQGPPNAKPGAGEWPKVCALLGARLPEMASQLVAPAAPSQPPPPQPPAAVSQAASSGGGTAVVVATAASAAGASGGAASGGGASGGAAAAAADAADAAAEIEAPLQRLLLECMSVGLAADGASIDALLRSTLAARQLPWARVAGAGLAALAALRRRRLAALHTREEAAALTAVAAASVSGRGGAASSRVGGAVSVSSISSASMPNGASSGGGGGGNCWVPAKLGRVVFKSTMPPQEALILHERLGAMHHAAALGCAAHLLYALLLDPPFAIFSWQAYAALLGRMGPHHRQVAALIAPGADAYAARRARGARGAPADDASHARLAAAVLLDALITDRDAAALEAEWGEPGGLARDGVSRGALQRLQADLAKRAAMAALLAAEAGWWKLELLLARLAAQAGAGVRPELFALMEVEGMQPAHARALHAAGLTSPELVAAADERVLSDALATAIVAPSATAGGRGQAGSVSGGACGRMAAARAARLLRVAAREHLVTAAQQQWEEAAAKAGGGAGDEGGATQRRPKPRGAAATVAGQAVVCSLDERSDAGLVERALGLWREQPSFGWAVVLQASSGGGGDGAGAPLQLHLGKAELAADAAAAAAAAQQRKLVLLAAPAPPAALALSWSDREVLVVKWPTGDNGGGAGAAAAGAGAAAAFSYTKAVRSAARAAFSDPQKLGVCCDAGRSLASLAAAGIDVRLQLSDPVAAFRLWQPGAEAELAAADESGAGGGGGAAAAAADDGGDDGSGDGSVAAERLLSAEARAVLPNWKLQVPMSLPAAARRAARAALLARALHPPLCSLLAAQRLAHAYESAALPLVRCAATAARCGLAIDRAAAAAALADARAQQTLLRSQLPRLAAAAVTAAAPGALPPQMRPGDESDVAALLQRLGLAAGRRGRGCSGNEAAVLAALRRAVGALCAGKPGAPAAGASAQVVLVLQALLTEARLRAVEAAAEALLAACCGGGSGSGAVQSGSGSGADSSGGGGGSLPLGEPPAPRRGVRVLHPKLELLPVTGAPATELAPACARLLDPEPLPLPALPVLALARSVGADGGAAPLLPLSAPLGVVLKGPAAAAAAESGGRFVPLLRQLQQDHPTVGPYPCTGILVDAAPARSAADTSTTTAAANSARPAPAGRVRGWTRGPGDAAEDEWVGATDLAHELKPAAAALEPTRPDAPPQGAASLQLARGAASLRACVAPAAAGSMFVGLRLVDLPVAVLAAASGDPTLKAACRAARRPLHAAADAWLASCSAGGDGSASARAAAALLRAAAAGAAAGSPLPPELAAPAVLATLLSAFAAGSRPGQVAAALAAGDGASAAAAATAAADSVWRAFPGAAELRARVVNACAKTGFVASLRGRPLRAHVPPEPGPAAAPAAIKARLTAERAAFAAYFSACLGDASAAVAAVLHGVAEEANAALARDDAGGSDGSDGSDGDDDNGGDGAEAAAATAAAAAPPLVAVVLCSGTEVVLQCPTGLVLPFIERAAAQLTARLPAMLGLAPVDTNAARSGGGADGGHSFSSSGSGAVIQASSLSSGSSIGTRSGGGGGNAAAAAVAGGGDAQHRFPVRFWWGRTLDDTAAAWHRQAV